MKLSSRLTRARPHLLDGVLALLLLVAVGGATMEWLSAAGRNPPTPIQAGPELVMVLIASSDCAGIRIEGFEKAVKIIRSEYMRQAERHGESFSSIGIAVDMQVAEGISMLRRFGPFDEVLAGRGWLNTGAVRYIWKDMAGIPGVPQIMLVRRQIDPQVEPLIHREEILMRRSGGQAIVSWAKEIVRRRTWPSPADARTTSALHPKPEVR